MKVLIKDLENSIDDLNKRLESTPDDNSCAINTTMALIAKTEYILGRLKKLQ
jgi:hypothetical protein